MSLSVSNLLRECHRLRRHLRELLSEIDLGPRVLKILQQTLGAAEAAHKDHHETIKKLKLKQKDDEVTLKQTETMLAKYQSDVNTAGSKKEYELKLTEIATASARKGVLEEAILTTIMDIEDRTAGIPAAEETWATAQADFKQYQIDAAERMERLKADQVLTQATLDATDAKLPQEMKVQYLRLVKSYGADSLAGVSGKTCGQCRTNITDQQRTTLLSGSFLSCAHCGRGLYLNEG